MSITVEPELVRIPIVANYLEALCHPLCGPVSQEDSTIGQDRYSNAAFNGSKYR